jgi:hypothetical protein
MGLHCSEKAEVHNLLAMRKQLFSARGYKPYLGKFILDGKRDERDDDHKSKIVFKAVFILML